MRNYISEITTCIHVAGECDAAWSTLFSEIRTGCEANVIHTLVMVINNLKTYILRICTIIGTL